LAFAALACGDPPKAREPVLMRAKCAMQCNHRLGDQLIPFSSKETDELEASMKATFEEARGCFQDGGEITIDAILEFDAKGVARRVKLDTQTQKNRAVDCLNALSPRAEVRGPAGETIVCTRHCG